MKFVSYSCTSIKIVFYLSLFSSSKQSVPVDITLHISFAPFDMAHAMNNVELHKSVDVRAICL